MNLELTKRIVSLNNRITNLKSQSNILSNFTNNFNNTTFKGKVEISIIDVDDLIPFGGSKTSFNVELTKDIAKILVSDINSKITILENDLYHLQRQLNQNQ